MTEPPEVPIGTKELKAIDAALTALMALDDLDDREILLRLFRQAWRWGHEEGLTQALLQHADHDRRLIAVERDRIGAGLNSLIMAVATASPDRRQLLAGCQRCRNRMLYLLPRATGGQIAARLGALPLDHERHGEAEHPDDNPPQL